MLKDLAACRTGAYGVHEYQCLECGYRESRPNSCRNRHCPTCGGAARARWLDKRLPQLLPTSYFQVVFTLPHELLGLSLTQPAVLYKLLFRTAWRTLQELAADPRYLGAGLGALAVLHTWNQELQPHPHVHFVLPCGGLSADGQRWIPFRESPAPRRDSRDGAFANTASRDREGAVTFADSRPLPHGRGSLSSRRDSLSSPDGASSHAPAAPSYFFPYKVLSRLFRGKFLAALARAYRSGELVRETLPQPWREPRDFQQRIAELRQAEWVVYQEAPPPGLEPAVLVKYLARYVSGMAISDQRLVSCQQGVVTFTVKNRVTGQSEPRQVSVAEFLSRFLQHVLPPGLTRIRYYGFWSTNNAAKRERCRQLLLAGAAIEPATVEPPAAPAPPPAPTDVSSVKREKCPQCQKHSLVLVAVVLIAKWVVRGTPLWTPGSPLPRRLWPRLRPELQPALQPAFLSAPLTVPNVPSAVSAGEEPPRAIWRDSS